MSVKPKSLAFNILCYPLITRVFASERESVRKNSLIFRGKTENSDRKIKIRLQSVSALYCLHSGRIWQHLFLIESAMFYWKLSMPQFHQAVSRQKNTERDTLLTKNGSLCFLIHSVFGVCHFQTERDWHCQKSNFRKTHQSHIRLTKALFFASDTTNIHF